MGQSDDQTDRKAEMDADRAAVAAFDAKLQALEKERRQRSPDVDDAAAARRSTAIGTAFRISTELVAGLIAGGGLGWVIDYLAGTKPWFFLIFFFLGVVAGIMNVFRTATLMVADQEDQEKANRTSTGEK